MASSAFRRMGSLLLGVHDSKTPTDAEWKVHLDIATQLHEAERGGAPPPMGLIFTDGGAPNGPQRLAAAAVLQGRSVDTAVVSDSVVLRAVMKVLAFVNPGIRVFSSAQWPQAAAFVRLGPEARSEVLQAARELGRDIGGSRVLDAIPLERLAGV